jgi:hypothetical protein
MTALTWAGLLNWQRVGAVRAIRVGPPQRSPRLCQLTEPGDYRDGPGDCPGRRGAARRHGPTQVARRPNGPSLLTKSEVNCHRTLLRSVARVSRLPDRGPVALKPALCGRSLSERSPRFQVKWVFPGVAGSCGPPARLGTPQVPCGQVLVGERAPNGQHQEAAGQRPCGPTLVRLAG